MAKSFLNSPRKNGTRLRSGSTARCSKLWSITAGIWNPDATGSSTSASPSSFAKTKSFRGGLPTRESPVRRPLETAPERNHRRYPPIVRTNPVRFRDAFPSPNKVEA